MRSKAAFAFTVSSWMLASPALADTAAPPLRVAQSGTSVPSTGVPSTTAGVSAPSAAPPPLTTGFQPQVAPAPQPPGELGIVHLETSDDVELEMQQSGQWITVCHAPCNRPLPLDANYRINGSGIRTSAPFRLQRGATNLLVDASSSTLHGFSIAITVVGVVGAVPALGVTSILVVGMFFGFALICPIVDGTSSTSYGECLGDVGAFFGNWYAYPGVWIPGVAGAALITGGVIGLASSPKSTVTAVPSPMAGVRRLPDRQPEWHVDPMATVGARPVTLPLLRYTF